jgi:hypothetical protein
MSDHYGDLRLKEANKHLSDVLEDVTKKEESIFEKGLDLLARPFTCWIDPNEHSAFIDNRRFNPERHVNLHNKIATHLYNAQSPLCDGYIIKPSVINKPHITFVHGYWRLSNLSDSCLYHKTHAFIYNLNSVIHHEKSKISKV